MTSNRSALQSLVSFRNSQGEYARGTLLKLDRSSVVFEVYNPYSVVQLSEVLRDLTIRRGERVIYDGRAVVSNLVNTGLMLIVSLTLVDGWRDFAEILADPEHLREDVDEFIGYWANSRNLRPGYRLAVGELRAFLSEFNRWLEPLDATVAKTGPRGPVLEVTHFEELAGPSIERLNTLFKAFEGEAAEVGDEELAMHKAFAQRDLHPLMMRSPFFHRSFHKPLGYAGDYEMVNMMLRDRREGPTLFAQVINAYYHQIGPTVAHRNRIEILVEYLKRGAAVAREAGKPLRVLNVGCGPGLEIQRLVREDPICEQIHFDLVDFSQETLDHARVKIEEAAHASGHVPQIQFKHNSVHHLLKAAAQKKAEGGEPEYDFAYCAGLFDYLSDRVCSRLLRLFYRWTRPGGVVLATNVHPDNPARWTMEHVVEWHLIHRDAEQMLKLVPDLGTQRVYGDATGLNVFLETTKPDGADA